MKHLRNTLIAIVILVLAACGGSSGQPPSGKPFSYSVDASLKPSPEVRGGKMLAAAQSEGGTVHLFVLDEILINPRSQAELDAFLSRTNGLLIGNNTVPEPPAGSGIQIRPEYKTPTQYLVKVDPTRFDLGSFKADAEKSGLSGATVFSSDGAARLLAGIVREKAAGLSVSPNFVAEGDALLYRTEEQPLSGGGYEDALSDSRFASTGSRTSVAQMMQLIAAQPPTRRARVAILDGGFWLDASGNSLSADLPTTPLQYDFEGDDYTANGIGSNTCSGGSSCPWHGTGAAHVATAIPNNRFGAAGTGGQVADPMLFKINLYYVGAVARAIRTAVAWGADVISMSFGYNCDNFFCDAFFEDNIYAALRNARDNGVVMTAAAGNSGDSANGRLPCKASEDVICVGALTDDGNTRFNVPGWWASSFGSAVDIWAPTNLKAIYGNDPAGSLTLVTFGGTSASTPFIAGIAAALKAYNPSLTSAQVTDLLRRTAWTDSPDSTVSHYVNAYRALREVHSFSPDALETNNASATATALGTPGSTSSPTQRNDLNLHSLSDRDHFRFTLSEYASLAIDIEFIPALGDLILTFIKESGAVGVPERVSNELRSDGRGRIYGVGLVPPGTYRLAVAPASSTNSYNLRISRTDRPMTPDAYEANDTLATARGLSSGSFNANLHNLSDVDYYWFNPSVLTGVGNFFFTVTTRDMPLTLRLFNSSDTEISNLNCNSSAACALNIPGGVHKVKVEPLTSTRGRYTFQAQLVLDRNDLFPDFNLFPDRPFFWLEPGDPAIPGHLIGLQDLFAFREVGKANKGILIGEGLKFSLLSKTGQVIRQSTPSTNPQLPGAEISLSGLQNNELYVLLIERLNAPGVIDNEIETLGSLPYSLDLGN
ncbi:S8/S53 family peptidase [uncultured Meiothermus sp.]|uniref:S8/S53 family peptidase n=1 Tax=uncultured Meiothermus sp. TaxID=157471 RepID=UPI0026260F89|nr:S8/S53 family peptidase [uncultured Meiothermus sp.]